MVLPVAYLTFSKEVYAFTEYEAFLNQWLQIIRWTGFHVVEWTMLDHLVDLFVGQRFAKIGCQGFDFTKWVLEKKNDELLVISYLF